MGNQTSVQHSGRTQGKSLSAALAIMRKLWELPKHKEAIISKERGALFIRIRNKNNGANIANISIDEWID